MVKDGDKPGFVKAFEKDQAKEQEILESFCIDDFVADADVVKTVSVEGVGKVKYKRLTVADSLELQKAKNDTERTVKIISLMLGKADPAVTEEKVRKLHPSVASKILDALVADAGFLPQNS